MYKGSVTAHKKGREIVFKPSGLYAHMAMLDIKRVMQYKESTNAQIYTFGINAQKIADSFKKNTRLRIVDIISGMHANSSTAISELQANQVNTLFHSYELEVFYSPSLLNFISKESRRQKLETTPFSTEIVSTDLPLFERCSTGTNLLCVKDFSVAGKVLFNKGNRYMVVETGDEIDKIVIGTNPVKDGVTINLAGNGARHEWTPFDDDMAEWFDDSSSDLQPEKNLFDLYPDLVNRARKKLDSLNLELFDHVKEDAIAHSLVRSSMDCKLMRMGKSSTAIAAAEIIGSQKIAVITTKNIRIFWEKEFKRLGIKSYVYVNSLADLKKDVKYFVITFNWLRQMTDEASSSRGTRNSYLRKEPREITVKKNNKKEKELVDQFNDCPHCGFHLERPVVKVDDYNHKYTEWTQLKGYLCRNKDCKPTYSNSKKKGAAWYSEGTKVSKPGSYIDITLAQHSHCDHSLVKGRQCPTCKATDGVWEPPIARRFDRKFTMTIGDEIHNAKDISTLTAAGIYRLRSRRKKPLTGTPMSNSVMDVYWPLHWMYGSNHVAFPFTRTEGFKKFEDKFCQHIYLEKPTGETGEDGKEIIKTTKKRIPFLSNPVEFWQFIGSKVIRRSYSDPLYQQSLVNAGLKLPKVTINKVVCPMHPDQAQLMLSGLQNFKDKFTDMANEAEAENKEVNEALVIAQMATLRTIATSPERLNETYGKDFYKGPDGGGKTENIVALVKQKLDLGEKVVILSDFVDMQKTLEEELKGLGVIRFMTSWNDEKRGEAFTKFAEDKKCRVFIAGTRAVREGVDLSSASSVICCDLLWSPAWQAQAWSRTMAPTKIARNCNVYLMLSKNSLDEHIFNVFYAKMTAAEQAFDRKVVGRRAQHVDIKSFVDKILEDEEALSLVVRDFDEGMLYVPEMSMSAFGDRI